MYIKNRGLALFMAAAMSLTFVGCAKEDNTPTFTGETTEEAEYQDYLDMVSPAVYGNVEGLELEPGTYISIIGKSESAAYWQMIEKGVMQAADNLNAALGYTGEDKIKVTYNAPSEEENIDEQVNILDEELSRYPDVLGIASVDEDACVVQFDLATTNGIPIISLDSGNTYKGILCTVKTDNIDAARTGAYKLADEIQEGSVILLVHDSESESAREREESFLKQMEEEETVAVGEVIYCDQLDELKKQIIAEQEEAADESDAAEEQAGATEEITGTEESLDVSEAEDSAAEEQEEAADESTTTDAADDVSGSGQKEEAQVVYSDISEISDEAAIQYYIEKHGATGVFGTNPAATQLGIRAMEACENSEEIVVMGFDAGEDQIKALKEGKIDGLVVQNPFGIGYASVIAAARTVLEIGNEAIVDTGYVWVTQSNIEEESIQKMLYE